MYSEFLPTLFLGGSRGARGWDADAPFALSAPAIMAVGGEHISQLLLQPFLDIKMAGTVPRRWVDPLLARPN